MTPEQKLRQKQSEMQDSLLIYLANKEIDKLCKTGGRSFRMSIPVKIDDTDMILSELVRRFEKLVNSETE